MSRLPRNRGEAADYDLRRPLLALALEVFALAYPLFLQWTIDDVIVSADRDLLTTLALGFGVLVLMQQAVGALRSWGILSMSTALKVQWRANVFSHLMRLPMQYFEKRHLADVLSRIASIDQIQRTLTTSFLEAILDGLMAVVTLRDSHPDSWPPGRRSTQLPRSEMAYVDMVTCRV